MTLSAEQQEFRAAVRQFAENKIAPRAAELDRTATYSWDNFADCRAMELPALGIPVEFGGSGADSTTQAIMVEELARVCASTALTILISRLATIPILNRGSDELKRRYVPLIASGEKQGSYCLSEPGAGSDVASMQARAVRDGDSYVLSGMKSWITNAGISDIYIVFAKTDPEAGSRGISCFVVEREFGLTFGKMEDKLGVRGSPTGEVILEGARVPVENRIGDEGEGFSIAMNTLNRSRPTIGAQAVGIAQGAIDHAVDYVKSREQFGRPIAELQGLQFMLADMAMKTEAARGLVYRATSLIDEGDPDGELPKIGAMAKCMASDTAMEVTTNAIQLLGGYGYVKDFPMERYFRDAKVTQIYEGTNQVQRVVIARRLLS
ncbi:MAG: acyl-CoA dehydrogenase family protein [Acidimicrobiia bacterium]|nr:acyl-CoA dehydrogenase family protein [Acidimicrobiia bacterium]MBV8983328.1 acyl-CoA dehydrogenase family protein [Acidimicrobiia bacterium]